MSDTERMSPLSARILFTTLLLASAGAGHAADVPPYCAVATPGAFVEVSRPAAGDPPLDDVNWFARPVPNAKGERIVAVASHNLNYLYNLTTGKRIRIPDKSDAVATPDGRYVTVPSSYTANFSINFYDASTLVSRLDAGRDAADVPAVYEHRHPDVREVYYQSVGIVSHTGTLRDGTTVYRMMFSGTIQPDMPGFRVVDYTFVTKGGALTVTPSVPMQLCPQITRDLATPFISKDGRYVVAHDDSKAGQPASLKIFEVLSTDPAGQTTTCAERVDFGFAAGKADFSFDGRALAFHISKFDYLTPFVDGGLKAPALTDVVVVDLERDSAGRLVGAGKLSRLTTSTTEGVGHYFPAFFPDGKVFYIANLVPNETDAPKRFELRVVDPAATRRVTNLFASPARRESAEAIGELWRHTCAPTLATFRPQEAAWAALSLSPAQCRQLVEEKWLPVDDDRKAGLLEACEAE
ncbi:MAG: hypothetical protein FJ171_04305 [Gammaproteobacteria bacterium]|nr:hypothetical protein [Gammaproteobacteria bacterium]